MRAEREVRLEPDPTWLGVVLFCAAIAIFAVGCARSEVAAPSGANASVDGEWTSYGRTPSEQRFSPLKQIDEQTVSRLGLVWSHDLGTLRGLEATPLVKDGVLYTTSAWSLVYAFNAATGQLRWTYDPHVLKDHSRFVCCDVVNRGLAYHNGRLYLGTLDGRLIALDAKKGEPVWQVQTTPKDSPYAITGAPRIAKGRVIIGNAGAEYAVRGYLSAYDAENGSLVWRTYTVPGDPSKPFESEALRKAASTWGGEWWKLGGGGTVWDSIVYDPDLDLVLFGTGNGSPWYPELRGSVTGDSLYTASIVAVRADTGEYVWHYQPTPGDSWDYDATQPLLLADLSIEGRSRRVVVQANKNGFFYVIDRENGQLISGRPYTTVTWASGLDAKGRPIEAPDARALKGPTVVQPSAEGAHNWNPISFNPATGLVYMGVLDDAGMHAIDRTGKLDLKDSTMGGDTSYAGPMLTKWLAMKRTGRLVAWDPATQREAWRVDFPQPKSGGTMTTAGNLVFQGRADGTFTAYGAASGKPLWNFDAGVGVSAAPMTYEIDGRQYVAVLAGWGGAIVLYNLPAGAGKLGFGNLLVFALDGKGTLPKYQREAAPVPAPEVSVGASATEIAEGGALFGLYCQRCHGGIAISGGSVLDLRYAETYIHQNFQSIVLGGERRLHGMPAFADSLTEAQVRKIQAYVLNRTRESAAARP
jgi:quinohemoprotein ethanol dehydrogenase